MSGQTGDSGRADDRSSEDRIDPVLADGSSADAPSVTSEQRTSSGLISETVDKDCGPEDGDRHLRLVATQAEEDAVASWSLEHRMSPERLMHALNAATRDHPEMSAGTQELIRRIQTCLQASGEAAMQVTMAFQRMIVAVGRLAQEVQKINRMEAVDDAECSEQADRRSDRGMRSAHDGGGEERGRD